MANIQTYLNNIKTAVFGSEVRDSIHDAIQQCYDDASAKDNANMEVKMARGEYENLGKRLDSHSSQIKEKVNYQEVDDKIAKAQLEAGNVDTSSFVVKSELENSIKNGKLYLNLGIWEDGFIDSSGVPTTNEIWNTFRRTANFYTINKNLTYTFKATNGAKCIIRKYDSDENYIGSVETSSTLNVKFTDCDLIKVTINNADSSATQQSEKNVEITTNYNGVFALVKDYEHLIQTNSSLLKDYFQAIPTGANPITLDTTNKTIYFPKCYIYSNGKLHFTTSETTLSYEGFTTFAWIYANSETNGIELKDNFVNESNMLFLGLIETKEERLNLSHVHFSVKILGQTNYGYEGKTFGVIGDSISTFVGISEDSQNGTTYRKEYYPSTTANVSTYSDMWWGIVQDELGMIRTGISAISQSCYRTQNDDTRQEAYADARISRIATDGTPNYIFLALGTNDGYNSFNLDYDGEIDKDTLLTNNTKTAPACALTILKVQEAYPNAKIIVVIPKFCNITKLGYSSSNFMKTCNGIELTAKSLGVYKVIDLRKCGINYSNVDENTIDGIHPNKSGMTKIGNYIIEQLTN